MSELEAEFRQSVREELKEIREDLKTLLAFKWQIIGGATAFSTLISIAITILLKR